MLINRLKSLVVDREDLDDLIALSYEAKALRQEYELNGMPGPEWLNDAIKTLGKEVQSRRVEYLELRKKQIAARRKALRSKEEELAELNKEAADIDKLLGVTPVTS